RVLPNHGRTASGALVRGTADSAATGGPHADAAFAVSGHRNPGAELRRRPAPLQPSSRARNGLLGRPRLARARRFRAARRPPRGGTRRGVTAPSGAAGLGHLAGDPRDALAERSGFDDADVGAESEDPGDDLGAETHAHTDVDPAAAHERFLRAVPAVAAHER